MKFSEVLKQFRQRNDLTQQRAAQLVSRQTKPFEVTLKAWRNYENENREPCIPVRQVIENAINDIER